MRVSDQPLPTVSGPRPPQGWQTNLYVTLGRLPLAGYLWDDYEASWDDPLGRYEWDDLDSYPYDRFDVTCQWSGLDITVGTNNPDGAMEAAEANLTLDNRDGQFSQYDSFGRLVGYGPGVALDIWAEADGEPWWLFRGRVVRWQERPNRTVELQAFDRFSDLNEDPGGEWIPGTRGDTPAVRLGHILDMWGHPAAAHPRSFASGRVTLHAKASKESALVECQKVAESDGGIFGMDVDGTTFYWDRNWRGGRADQEEVRAFSDNVCQGATVVWDPVILTDDDLIINIANLTNLPEPVPEVPEGEEEPEEPPPISVTARNPSSVDRHGAQTTTDRDEDQWLTLQEGEELAQHIVNTLSEGYLRIEEFTLYLHTGLWREGIDMRVGDLINFVRDQHGLDAPARLSLLSLVCSINHSITPNAWLTTFGTTRATGDLVTVQWDAGEWLTWDADPTYYWDGVPPQPVP